ncbi:unnamed protein product [Closterium sp. Naga37s-1]|nr:unnamed protein product [Closterium sp. Naga37s-1]
MSRGRALVLLLALVPLPLFPRPCPPVLVSPSSLSTCPCPPAPVPPPLSPALVPPPLSPALVPQPLSPRPYPLPCAPVPLTPCPCPTALLLSSAAKDSIGTDGSQLTGTYEGLTWLSSLSNLQTLNLFGLAEFTGSLSSLHVLSHLENLRSLTLKSLTNATGEIPREIRYLTALTALDLSYLRALEFPAWVTHLSILQYLNVNADDPRRQGLLTDDISHLTALTTLSLKGNNLDGYLPKSFSSLLNLQYL